MVADEEYATTVITLIEVFSQAYILFESSEVVQKRQLLHISKFQQKS